MGNLVNQIGKDLENEKAKARFNELKKAFFIVSSIGLVVVGYAALVYGISTILPSGPIKVFGTIAAIIPGLAAIIVAFMAEDGAI